jgi:hypothetical protein
MRAVIVSLALCMASSVSACAEDAEAPSEAAASLAAASWRDPNNNFSLDFERFGWSQLPPPNNAGDSFVVAIEHRAFQADGAMRFCTVFQEVQPLMFGGQQRDMNTLLRSRAATAAQGVLDAPPVTHHVLDINGVAVLDAIGDTRLYQHARVFYLVDGRTLRQIIISCGAAHPATPEVRANIASMLQTLRIAAE